MKIKIFKNIKVIINIMNTLPKYSNVWIDCNDLKNYIYDDPLLDWLNLYGKDTNYHQDSENNDLQFGLFLSKQGSIFKTKIIDSIKEKIPHIMINRSFNFRKKISETIDNMSRGIPVIINGHIFSSKNKLVGSPDVLIRSDYLSVLFKNNEEHNHPSKFSDDWHYCILDIRFTKLHLASNKKNILNNGKPMLFLKSKTIINNLCLNEMQDYKSHCSYILGNSTNFEIENNNYFESKLGLIDTRIKDRDILAKIYSGIIWIQDLKKEGNEWNVIQPCKKELYPNMSNTDDYPWHNAKIKIARELYEITLLWSCGPKERDKAHNKGIYQWNNCKSNDLSIENNKKAKIVDNMIDMNKYENQVVINPRKIKNKENVDRLKQYDIEFYVDFETVGNFSDNFEDYHHESIIFMIGCLTVYKINNQSYNHEFKNFITTTLDSQQEELILNQWINYMNEIKKLYSKENRDVFVYHWSSAEPAVYNTCCKKYNITQKLNFNDLLDIFKNEPITIKDAFSYNLKTISKCFYKHGLIKTIWDSDSIIDGKNAMFQAWKYYNGNKQDKSTLREIEKYNYIDCKVMEEIISHLRKMI